MPTPITPGVCCPPPATPASVLNVMPAGVMLVSSRLTTITPFASGISITMHSKQPQAVIGFSMMEYIATSCTTSCDPILA